MTTLQNDTQQTNLSVRGICRTQNVVTPRLSTAGLDVSSLFIQGIPFVQPSNNPNVVPVNNDTIVTGNIISVNGNIEAKTLSVSEVKSAEVKSTAEVTNGDCSLVGIGSKFVINDATPGVASIGVSGPMYNGQLTITTTACTPTSKVFVTRASFPNSAAIPSSPQVQVSNGSFRIADPSGGFDESDSFWNWIIFN